MDSQRPIGPTLRLIFERQWVHALCLAILVALLACAARLESVQAGQRWGLESGQWLWIAAGIAIAHQAYVWFCWRTELHASLLSRVLGRAAFPLYAVGFSILIVSRVWTVFVLAESNRGTFPANPMVLKSLAMLAVVPAAYLFYSVHRYFGMRRPFGIDHFDESYRALPIVREGIFRFTPNGMYVFGFLILWIPGLWYASTAALCVALFSHVYIWVHHHATERPDMLRIYARDRTMVG